ncbi:molybdate ABC transporter substrate-binding protein [Methylobacterium brachythecii]|nr:substrate-binding domain-containing protein [Methylobacterium brachythecii]MBB3903711.1 molybdate transport system substrate-binding protein [Methylobacterium brachythecii]
MADGRTVRGEAVQAMCALVVKGAFDASLIPTFAAQGDTLDIMWAPTTVIQDRLAEGGRPDMVLVLSGAMDTLEAEGLIHPESRVDVCRSRYGVAVKAGAPHPRIDTLEAFKSTLTGARSVAYSRAGASGIYFAGLLPRLGIADAVNARATIIPAGFTATKLVSGEADIAVQQISELMVVPGIEVVGPYPEGAQEETTFCAAILREATAPDAAQRFLSILTDPSAAEAYRSSGLEPAS